MVYLCPKDATINKVVVFDVVFQKAEKGYRRLTPDQPVGLKYTGQVLNVESVVCDDKGEVTELKARITPLEGTSKPKAFIHWVSEPLTCEVRIYERL